MMIATVDATVIVSTGCELTGTGRVSLTTTDSVHMVVEYGGSVAEALAAVSLRHIPRFTTPLYPDADPEQSGQVQQLLCIVASWQNEANEEKGRLEPWILCRRITP